MIVVLAAPIVVWQLSMLAGRYYYGSLSQSQSSSEPAVNTVPRMHPQPAGSSTSASVMPTEGTTALEETTALQAPEGTPTSSTARIACLRADHGASSPPNSTQTLNGHSLTRVATPKVAAHPDGVHVQFDNRLGKRAEYFAEDSKVAWGVPIPKGKSNQVALLPPGTANLNCSLPGDFEYRYASFEVVEGDSGYKSLELECAPGAEPRFSHFIASGAGSKLELVSYRDPLEEAREYYKKGLKEGDVVEAAGYPTDPNPTVRVVRDGKVIATYWSAAMEMYATYCPVLIS